jgi:hypothetical protein
MSLRVDYAVATRQAAKVGDEEEVGRLLAENGGLLTWRGPGIGHTALHWAAAKGHTALVELLLAAGAGPDVTNAEASTPLHSAAANGELACVKVCTALRSPAGIHGLFYLTLLHPQPQKISIR